jgi:hypothetical protein
MRRALLLSLALPLFGCDGTVISPFGGPGGGFGVPGEETPSEEEALPVFERDGMTIGFDLRVEDSAATVDYRISYWADLDRDLLNCDQRWSIDGALAAPPTGCPDCTGRIAMIPSTAADVSEPMQRGSDCDPVLVAAAQADLGRAMLTPEGEGGLADLLELSWLSAADHEAGGGAIDAQGDFDFAFMQQVAASLGRSYEGVILLNDLGGLSAGIDLPSVAGDAGGGSGWSPFFFLLRDPATNAHEGPDLQGLYEAQGVFSVGFAQ